MAWENYDLVQQRLRLVTSMLSNEANITSLCKEYNISRPTAYKWLERYLSLGEDGLKCLPRTRNNLGQIYSDKQIDILVDYKRANLTWGPKKLIVNLKRDYPDYSWPGKTRFHEILKDYDLVKTRKLRNRVPATAPLGDLTGCNDTWSVDLKGWFLVGNGDKCEPLTITDNYSRFLIKCVHTTKHSVDYIWPIFADAFREFGLPNRVRSDNGPPFGSTGVARLTPLAVKLIRAGVTPEWIRPGHPEENGRHERFHSTLKEDTANPPKATIPLQIKAMNDFHEKYNYDRPHESLGMKTPASCYHRSHRSWDGVLRAPEYDTNEMIVRKICSSGCIWLNGKEHYIGQTVEKEYIGLKPTENDELDLYYGPIYLGKITQKGFEKPKLMARRRK